MKKKATSLALGAFISIFVGSACGSGGPTPDTQKLEIEKLYSQYKARDLENDPKIMDLYSDDAHVALSGASLSKDQYSKVVEEAYKAAPAENKKTEYDALSVELTGPGQAEARFTARLGEKHTNVYWMLKRDPKKKAWFIQSESYGFGN